MASCYKVLSCDCTYNTYTPICIIIGGCLENVNIAFVFSYVYLDKLLSMIKVINNVIFKSLGG